MCKSDYRSKRQLLGQGFTQGGDAPPPLPPPHTHTHKKDAYPTKLPGGKTCIDNNHCYSNENITTGNKQTKKV